MMMMTMMYDNDDYGNDDEDDSYVVVKQNKAQCIRSATCNGHGLQLSLFVCLFVFLKKNNVWYHALVSRIASASLLLLKRFQFQGYSEGQVTALKHRKSLEG
jgi:hypothetical protein